MRFYNVIFLDDFRGNIEEIFEGCLLYDFLIYVYILVVVDKLFVLEGKIGIYVLMLILEFKIGSGIDWLDEVLI